MKKFIMVLVCLMTITLSFTSCVTDYKYLVTTNYDVCYPDTTKTFNVQTTEIGKENSEFYSQTYSIGGTNYISVFELRDLYRNKASLLESTTAPIRLNYYNVEKVGKIKKSKKLFKKNEKTNKFEPQLKMQQLRFLK